MKLKIAQVVGLNTDQKAAQVISSVRDSENTFLAVLQLSCDDAFTKGRSALSELEDYYFEFEGGAADKLNATFKEANKKFSPGDSFDLCLGSISGKILYLIGKGQIEAYLKRADHLSALLSVGVPSQLISGFLKMGDRLLFSTKSLVTFLGSDLEKSLGLPLETFEEEVGSRISSSELEDQGLAALALEVEKEVEEVSIPPLPKELEQKVEQEYLSRTQSVVKTVLNRVISSFRRLRVYFPRSGRGRLILAIILIIIIALGALLQYKASRDQQKLAQFNQVIQVAKDDFNAAKGLITLNPQEAKSKLDSAKDKVNKALSLKPQDSDAQNLKKQIEQDSSSILKQSSVSDFPLFLDMDLVKKNFKATQMSLSAGKLLLLDPDVKTLVVVDVAKKSNQILAGSEQLGEANLASLNGALAFVYSKDKGVLRVDTLNQKVITVSKKDAGWGNILDIVGFASNIYLLDLGNPSTGSTSSLQASSGQIWKYLPTSEGYSDKREYLTGGGSAAKDTKVDFANVIRMQIESSVYVLKKDGQILRFTRGAKDNFSYAGLDKGVKDPKSFFVSSDTDNLYLLDSGNSRLLILTKTGSYKGQISGEKFGSATDLVVDEKGKKVYLLEGSKIYTVDLK